jgi:hypothetical protein
MRDDNPQISFADLELMRQGVEMDPVLKQVSAYVEQHPELVQAVEQHLQQGLKKPKTGRRGLTAAQLVLSWILMRIKNWDYPASWLNASAMESHCVCSPASTVTRCLGIRHSTAGITA